MLNTSKVKKLNDFIKKQANSLTLKEQLKRQKISNFKNGQGKAPLNFGEKKAGSEEPSLL